MVVVGLYRYPVKSMTGEPVESLEMDSRGCVGDRVWAVRTARGKIGSGKSTRRFEAVRGLMRLRAAYVNGKVVVTLPDGTTVPAGVAETDSLISQALGRPVALVREGSVSHFDDGPVSLLGTASVGALAAQRGQAVSPLRFRANVLLGSDAPFGECDWIGKRVKVGTAELRISMASPRCVMLNMATADLPAQSGNLRAVAALTGGHLGVVATVDRAGEARVGDVVTPIL